MTGQEWCPAVHPGEIGLAEDTYVSEQQFVLCLSLNKNPSDTFVVLHLR